MRSGTLLFGRVIAPRRIRPVRKTRTQNRGNVAGGGDANHDTDQNEEGGSFHSMRRVHHACQSRRYLPAGLIGGARTRTDPTTTAVRLARTFPCLAILLRYNAPVVPQFAYRARDAKGALVEGVVESSDRALAIRQVEQLRYVPIKIEMVGAPPKTVERNGAGASTSAPQSLKVSHGQLLVFTEQLAHLLRAGMTLDEALSILEKRLKQPRLQQMTRTLHQALVDGRSFSQALREFPRIFPPLYVNMVAAGEASGALPDILDRLVTHLTQAKNLRDRVQQALIYPAFLAMAGAVLITVFITYMVPQLTGFMAQNGGALPLPTRILIQVNALITGWWWLAAIIAMAATFGIRALLATSDGRIAWDRFRLRIPGYGRIVRDRYYAQFSRTLGTLMQNGVPLLRGLDLVAEIAENKYFESKLADARRSVIDGATLSAALAAQGIFPDLFTDMMAVGEQTGHFADTLLTIADVYERELDRSVVVVSQLIPPVIIVLIALIVGMVVYSILSAVFEMTRGLQMRAH